MTSAEMRMRIANRGKGSGLRAEAGEAGATIWLYDVIAADDWEAEFWGGVGPRAFGDALRAAAGPVLLRINSPGGSVFGAQAMVAAMREHPHAITARVDALAASAASVIAAEAARMEVVEGALVMIHRASGITWGDGDAHRDAADRLDTIDGQIAATYARRAGGDAEDWLAKMAAETWFTAAEAVEAGLADAAITDSTQRPAETASARWDLSAYAKAPPAPVPSPVPSPEPVARRAPERLRLRLDLARRFAR